MLKIKHLVATSLLVMSSVYAADGQVNFNGELHSDTCNITNAIGGNVNIILPNISANNFPSGSERAGQTAFDINLANCTDETGVSISFTGDANQVNANTGLFKNISQNNPATNIEVAVYDSTDTLVKAQGAASESVNIVSGNATIPMTVYYQATAAGVTAGSVIATGGINLVYR